jgi:regulator of sigma E protease
MLLTVGAAIVVLGVLIFVHELGHFLAAKSVGIAVLRFSFGLGPKTPLAWKVGETEYCLSWIPFGGFVQMAGAMDDEAAALEGEREDAHVPVERTFDAKPLLARVWVISAGVLMNTVFAVAVYALLAGMYGVATDPSTTVAAVRTESLPRGAAPLATLLPGDRIVRINGDTMTGWGDIEEALLTSETTPIRIEVAGRTEAVLVDVPLREQADRVALVRALTPRHEPVIGEVLAGYPAAAAGLLPNDRILVAGTDSITAWEQFVRAVERSPDQPLFVVVRRAGADVEVTVTPRAVEVAGRDSAAAPDGDGFVSVRRTVGRIGVAPYFPVEHFGVVGSLGQGVRRAADAGGLVLFTLKGLVTGALSPRDLGGPILVGQLSGEAARLGPEAFLGFMALFSMNLAVLNLLPIPVLDGGHLVFLAIEGVRRRPLSVEQRARLTRIGFVVLVGIMLLALTNDITRVVQKLF